MVAMTTRMMTSANGLRISSNAETNGNQGGGDKKAGLVPLKNAPVMRWTALNVAQTRNTLYTFNGIFGLRHTRNPRVRFSRPIGSAHQPLPYWSMQSIGA
tara:strand:+ start:10 stop:309 length:300 start_codon:yes stop_codon:yes gene_type:complete